jgi:hypothetical protein
VVAAGDREEGKGAGTTNMEAARAGTEGAGPEGRAIGNNHNFPPTTSRRRLESNSTDNKCTTIARRPQKAVSSKRRDSRHW